MKTCECGCGAATSVAIDNNRGRGYVKGHPVRYLPGHHRRGPKDSTPPFDARYEADPATGCMNWTSSLVNGHGTYWDPVARRKVPAHRYAYERKHGVVPKTLVIDHLCRNGKCVNPDHLEPVTQQINVLRGEGLAAKNAAKTHCIRGHEFTPENTYLHHGYRNCRRCASEANAAAYAERVRRVSSQP